MTSVDRLVRLGLPVIRFPGLRIVRFNLALCERRLSDMTALQHGDRGHARRRA